MSRKIKIYSDTEKGCIFFDGSTVEPKFIGTVITTEHPTIADRVIIKRTDRLQEDGVSFRVLFRKLNTSRIQNRDGENLVDDLGYTPPRSCHTSMSRLTTSKQLHPFS